MSSNSLLVVLKSAMKIQGNCFKYFFVSSYKVKNESKNEVVSNNSLLLVIKSIMKIQGSCVKEFFTTS